METKHYTVIKIEGDYATLRDTEGIEILVAMALLPPETDEGIRLRWEDLVYTAED